MKFSVVIPTRNRLDLLKYAIASILKQDYADWEVIISDNASTEDIRGYIESLHEPRIKYSRSDEFLSITENWNRCIDLSTGDYTIMIGDDDIFLKNYFQICARLIDGYDKPDLIYSNTYLYAYPGVIPSFPKGIFQSFGSLHGMPKKQTPYWLEKSYRHDVVQATLQFRSIYSTNMQHALISRSLLEKVKREGKFFHSPYPDIYAMSALFLETDRILIYPKELVVIGISSKSHGYYAINRKDQEAIDFLNSKKEMTDIESLKSILLPGFIVYTYWLGAIELFKIYFSLKKLHLKFDYNLYRKEQSTYILNLFLYDRNKFRNEFNQLMKHLTLLQKARFILPRLLFDYSEKKFPKGFSDFCRKMVRFFSSSPKNSYTPLNPPPCFFLPDQEVNKYSTILEIFEQIEPVDCTR